MFIYYLGIVLLIWLAVGFFTGLKLVWADDMLNKKIVEERTEEFLETYKHDEEILNLFPVFTKKINFLAACTLLGFFIAVLDIKKTLTKLIKFFKGKRIKKLK